jgi:hypothetical protein
VDQRLCVLKGLLAAAEFGLGLALPSWQVWVLDSPGDEESWVQICPCPH